MERYCWQSVCANINIYNQGVDMMKKSLFEGSGVAIVTPMYDDGNINYACYDRLLDMHLAEHTDAIIVCGTTGESATLSDNEKHKLIKYTVDKVKDKVPIIAGTGSNDTKYAIEMSVEAESIGVDGLLVVTPYYNKTSQEGLVEHYTAIADSVHTPIILYNVPSRTGCNISPDTCYRLSAHDNIVAIKEASGDISAVAKIIALCRENLDVYSGNDDQTIAMLSLGAKGVISVFANICPRVSHNIVQEYVDGNIRQSQKLLLDHLKLMDELFSDVNPIPVKEALNLMGYECGKCRLPLFNLSEEKREDLKNILSEYGLMEGE